MGSAYWSNDTEKSSDGLTKSFVVAQEWTSIINAIKNAGQYPPKYATNIQATVQGDFYPNNNYWGNEWARIGDYDSSAEGDTILTSDVTAKQWNTRSASLVSAGKVPSTLYTSGSGLFTNKNAYLMWSSNCEVIMSHKIRNRRISISWTDPTLTISTPASTGGRIEFTNSSSTTATYNGSQKYTVSYNGRICACTITAIPDEGYSFSHWADDTRLTNPKRDLSWTDADFFSATNTRTYTAVFVKKEESINNIYVGASKIKSIYIGNTPIKEVYIGTTKIY